MQCNYMIIKYFKTFMIMINTHVPTTSVVICEGVFGKIIKKKYMNDISFITYQMYFQVIKSSKEAMTICNQ